MGLAIIPCFSHIQNPISPFPGCGGLQAPEKKERIEKDRLRNKMTSEVDHTQIHVPLFAYKIFRSSPTQVLQSQLIYFLSHSEEMHPLNLTEN